MIPEDLATRIQADKNSNITSDQQDAINNLISQINSHSQVAPEYKTHLLRVLNGSPDKVLTAATFLPFMQSPGTTPMELVSILKKGFQVLRTGGAGRPPATTSVQLQSASSSGSFSDPGLSASRQPSQSSRSTRLSSYGSKLQNRPPERRCEICGKTWSGGSSLIAAHIIPVGATNSGRSPDFWKLLGFFWEKPDVVELQNILMADGVRSFSNGIVMEQGVHSLFDCLEIRLEPIWDSVTATSMDLAIRFNSNRRLEITNYWRPPLTSSAGVSRFNFEDGDEITLETSDPVEYPLPSPTLLHLRNVLTNVCFLSGAGYQRDPFEWDDDEDQSVKLNDKVDCKTESSYKNQMLHRWIEEQRLADLRIM
jgi:hypothetical protein